VGSGRLRSRTPYRAEGGLVPPAYRQAGGAVQGRFLILLNGSLTSPFMKSSVECTTDDPGPMNAIALLKREEE
jgi:hypothetical protein